jgi:hypothetical protein
VALSGEVAHLSAVVAALTRIRSQVLGILSSLIVVLELHLDWLSIEGALVIAESIYSYFLTHSAAAA